MERGGGKSPVSARAQITQSCFPPMLGSTQATEGATVCSCRDNRIGQEGDILGTI